MSLPTRSASRTNRMGDKRDVDGYSPICTANAPNVSVIELRATGPSTDPAQWGRRHHVPDLYLGSSGANAHNRARVRSTPGPFALNFLSRPERLNVKVQSLSGISFTRLHAIGVAPYRLMHLRVIPSLFNPTA